MTIGAAVYSSTFGVHDDEPYVELPGGLSFAWDSSGHWKLKRNKNLLNEGFSTKPCFALELWGGQDLSVVALHANPPGTVMIGVYKIDLPQLQPVELYLLDVKENEIITQAILQTCAFGSSFAPSPPPNALKPLKICPIPPETTHALETDASNQHRGGALSDLLPKVEGVDTSGSVNASTVSPNCSAASLVVAEVIPGVLLCLALNSASVANRGPPKESFLTSLGLPLSTSRSDGGGTAYLDGDSDNEGEEEGDDTAFVPSEEEAFEERSGDENAEIRETVETCECQNRPETPNQVCVSLAEARDIYSKSCVPEIRPNLAQSCIMNCALANQFFAGWSDGKSASLLADWSVEALEVRNGQLHADVALLLDSRTGMAPAQLVTLHMILGRPHQVATWGPSRCTEIHLTTSTELPIPRPRFIAQQTSLNFYILGRDCLAIVPVQTQTRPVALLDLKKGSKSLNNDQFTTVLIKSFVCRVPSLLSRNEDGFASSPAHSTEDISNVAFGRGLRVIEESCDGFKLEIEEARGLATVRLTVQCALEEDLRTSKGPMAEHEALFGIEALRLFAAELPESAYDAFKSFPDIFPDEDTALTLQEAASTLRGAGAGLSDFRMCDKRQSESANCAEHAVKLATKEGPDQRFPEMNSPVTSTFLDSIGDKVALRFEALVEVVPASDFTHDFDADQPAGDRVRQIMAEANREVPACVAERKAVLSHTCERTRGLVSWDPTAWFDCKLQPQGAPTLLALKECRDHGVYSLSLVDFGIEMASEKFLLRVPLSNGTQGTQVWLNGGKRGAAELLTVSNDKSWFVRIVNGLEMPLGESMVGFDCQNRTLNMIDMDVEGVILLVQVTRSTIIITDSDFQLIARIAVSDAVRQAFGISNSSSLVETESGMERFDVSWRDGSLHTNFRVLAKWEGACFPRLSSVSRHDKRLFLDLEVPILYHGKGACNESSLHTPDFSEVNMSDPNPAIPRAATSEALSSALGTLSSASIDASTIATAEDAGLKQGSKLSWRSRCGETNVEKMEWLAWMVSMVLSAYEIKSGETGHKIKYGNVDAECVLRLAASHLFSKRLKQGGTGSLRILASYELESGRMVACWPLFFTHTWCSHVNVLNMTLEEACIRLIELMGPVSEEDDFIASTQIPSDATLADKSHQNFFIQTVYFGNTESSALLLWHDNRRYLHSVSSESLILRPIQHEYLLQPLCKGGDPDSTGQPSRQNVQSNIPSDNSSLHTLCQAAQPPNASPEITPKTLAIENDVLVNDAQIYVLRWLPDRGFAAFPVCLSDKQPCDFTRMSNSGCLFGIDDAGNLHRYRLRARLHKSLRRLFTPKDGVNEITEPSSAGSSPTNAWCEQEAAGRQSTSIEDSNKLVADASMEEKNCPAEANTSPSSPGHEKAPLKRACRLCREAPKQLCGGELKMTLYAGLDSHEEVAAVALTSSTDHEVIIAAARRDSQNRYFCDIFCDGSLIANLEFGCLSQIMSMCFYNLPTATILLVGTGTAGLSYFNGQKGELVACVLDHMYLRLDEKGDSHTGAEGCPANGPVVINVHAEGDAKNVAVAVYPVVGPVRCVGRFDPVGSGSDRNLIFYSVGSKIYVQEISSPPGSTTPVIGGGTFYEARSEITHISAIRKFLVLSTDLAGLEFLMFRVTPVRSTTVYLPVTLTRLAASYLMRNRYLAIDSAVALALEGHVLFVGVDSHGNSHAAVFTPTAQPQASQLAAQTSILHHIDALRLRRPCVDLVPWNSRGSRQLAIGVTEDGGAIFFIPISAETARKVRNVRHIDQVPQKAAQGFHTSRTASKRPTGPLRILWQEEHQPGCLVDGGLGLGWTEVPHG